MKVILHGPAEDLAFGLRAIRLATERHVTEAAYLFGEGPGARQALARMNPSGSWTAWVQAPDAIEAVP